MYHSNSHRQFKIHHKLQHSQSLQLAHLVTQTQSDGIYILRFVRIFWSNLFEMFLFNLFDFIRFYFLFKQHHHHMLNHNIVPILLIKMTRSIHDLLVAKMNLLQDIRFTHKTFHHYQTSSKSINHISIFSDQLKKTRIFIQSSSNHGIISRIHRKMHTKIHWHELINKKIRRGLKSIETITSNITSPRNFLSTQRL